MKKTLFLLLISNYLFSQSGLVRPYQGIHLGDNVVPSNFTIPIFIRNSSSANMEFSGLNPYLTLYENGSFTGYLQTINSTFEIGTKNAANISFNLGGNKRSYFEGSTGKFFTSNLSSATFQGGLRIIGAFKVGNTNNPGTFGQVLRSMGNGNTPIWANFNYDPQISFSAVRNTNLTLLRFGLVAINNLTITYNDTPSTGIATNGDYTAPSAGFYHFDVNVPFFEWTGNATGTVGVEIYKNGTLQNTCYNRFGSFGMGIQQDGTKCGYDIKLNANDLIQFRIYMDSDIIANVNIPNSFLPSYQRLTVSGYKVY